MDYRIERDTLGEVKVPKDKYYGAVTQRSLDNFKIGTEKMPQELIYALAVLKLACARVNNRLSRLDGEKLAAIEEAVNEIISGKRDGDFPLSVWQTGSGTQTNMNLNEVIANRANEILGKALIHPNDDVNMSQSSNDVFPSAMHISATLAIKKGLIPALVRLCGALKALEEDNRGVIKSGRTHLQDATPIGFDQEISGWRSSIERAIQLIEASLPALSHLAIGGTAVGTGINAPHGFDRAVADEITGITGVSFCPDSNKFHALSSKCELVFAHGALKALAADLMKMANDIRWLASGPRTGLGEISIPANEPGSSIMPGKVNPTQCEALTMVAVQVMANDTAISFAASQGNFELNVFMPVIIYNMLRSVRLLADSVESFTANCVVGIKANREKMQANLNNSLMLATALTPYIGYENAARVVHKAFEEDITLKEACLQLGFLSAEEFDKYFKPCEMV